MFIAGMIIACCIAMNIQDIMTMIDAQRLRLGMHKATLCSKAGISTVYYKTLVTEAKTPSFGVVIALLDAVELDLWVVKRGGILKVEST